MRVLAAQNQQGWRWGVLVGSLCGSVVLIVNLVAAVLIHTRANGSQWEIFRGSCADSTRIDIGLHFLINILSTVLLAASNYAMQCISAPTRTEVDTAHGQRIWLDIGILSMRNLRYIGAKRVVLFLLLGLSSVPLHLL